MGKQHYMDFTNYISGQQKSPNIVIESESAPLNDLEFLQETGEFRLKIDCGEDSSALIMLKNAKGKVIEQIHGEKLLTFIMRSTGVGSTVNQSDKSNRDHPVMKFDIAEDDEWDNLLSNKVAQIEYKIKGKIDAPFAKVVILFDGDSNSDVSLSGNGSIHRVIKFFPLV